MSAALGAAARGAYPCGMTTPLPAPALAFLADVKDRFDDDAPRLIFADWLDDHGEHDRAEFLRAQCLLLSLPPGDPRRPALARRERELLRRRAADWLGPLAKEKVVWMFQRGLLRLDVNVTSALPGQLAALAASPAAPWLGELALTVMSAAPPSAVAALSFALATPDLSPPPALRLYGPGFDEHLMEAVASSPLVPTLTRLLATSCTSLCRGDAALLLRLLTEPRLARLAVLDLESSKTPESVARALAAAPNLASLRVVNHAYGRAGDAGAAALAASPRLAGLRVLNLWDNGVGDAGARDLAESPHLAGLERLILRGNPIGARARAALRRRFGDGVRFTGDPP
jgi:uncharacterized protein (TIGR02996 family)